MCFGGRGPPRHVGWRAPDWAEAGLPGPPCSRVGGPQLAGRAESTLWLGPARASAGGRAGSSRVVPSQVRSPGVPANLEDTSCAKPLGFPQLRMFPSFVPLAPHPLPQPFLLGGVCAIWVDPSGNVAHAPQNPHSWRFSAQNPRHFANIVTRHLIWTVVKNLRCVVPIMASLQRGGLFACFSLTQMVRTVSYRVRTPTPRGSRASALDVT